MTYHDSPTTTHEYNGWTNRETWATGLHLSNDYDLYHIARRLVTEADDNVREWYDMDAVDMPPIAQTHAAADALETWVADMVEDYHYNPEQLSREQRSLYRGIITEVGSFYRVDWREVADSFREE